MNETTNNSNDPDLYYWITLIALFILSLTVGAFGFQSYFIIHGEEHSWMRSIYRTIQLFTLEGGDLQEPIPQVLQIVRFTAPFSTIMALMLALLEIFKQQWNGMKIARMKNHVVIIGFGTKGKNIMEESLRRKEKVLVIESDPLNPNLASIKPPYSRHLIGDANNINTLKKAGITKAKSVFLLMGDDTKQVNACLIIYQLIKESRRDENNPLNCIIHLQKQEFLNTMRSHKLVKDSHDGLTMNIFNVYENSAREFFEEDPPDRSGIGIESKNYVQILIIGFGNAGEALALQTALTGHYINGKKPQVLIIDRMAKEKVPDFLERYPAFKDYCDLKYLALEGNSPQLLQHIVKYLEDPLAFTTMVLCFDNKTHNMLLGLQLESIKRNETDHPLQVFVRTNDNEPFADFSQNIKSYGLPSKVCSQEVIIGGDLDRKVQAIHADYLKKRKIASDFGTREADVCWENLSQEFKDSNRKVADHIGVKVRGIGCRIVALNDPQPAAIFSIKEIETLAELEHRRWNAERSLAGWTFSNKKNDKTRQTPYLTDWSNLSGDIKRYDRDSVKNIPDVLALVGLKVVRM
jgi:hypothetical protein